MQRYFIRKFLAGLTIAVPLGVTFGLAWWMLVAIDG